MRLNKNLVLSTQAIGKATNRSCAQQIEFWAELGKKLNATLTEKDAIEFLPGQTNLVMKKAPTYSFNAQEIAQKVRKDTELETDLLQNGQTVYSASNEEPNLLVAKYPNGTTKVGYFKNGEFQ